MIAAEDRLIVSEKDDTNQQTHDADTYAGKISSNVACCMISFAVALNVSDRLRSSPGVSSSRKRREFSLINWLPAWLRTGSPRNRSFMSNRPFSIWMRTTSFFTRTYSLPSLAYFSHSSFTRAWLFSVCGEWGRTNKREREAV
uniref:Uncharacterized protein n=1 Tax=Anopheles melas TaxID=34690 RepID=A0A182U5R8_9DIPT